MKTHRMKVRLRTLLYIVTVATAAIATFGVGGVIVAAWVLVVWGNTFSEHRIPWPIVCLWMVVPTLLFALVVPAIYPSHTRWPINSDMNNVKQVMLSLLNYEAKNGKLPPPFATDPAGTPLYSWRTLIWPFIEQDAAWDMLDKSQAWDSPANTVLARASFEPWQSVRFDDDSMAETQTNYFAVVDEVTVWPPNKSLGLADITDKPNETIVVIEVDRSDVHNMEPRDLTLDEAVKLLTHGPEHDRATLGLPPRPWAMFDNRSYSARSKRLVGFADGHAEALYPCDAAIARALLTRSGGETIPFGFNEGPPQVVQPFDPNWRRWKTLVSSAIFAMIAILPAFWWRRSRQTANFRLENGHPIR